MPSGGDSSNTSSGGALQFILPFGLFVNTITGANASFGNTSSPIGGAFSCAFDVLKDEALSHVFGAFFTGFQTLQCTGVLSIPVAGDLCSAVYPIVNDRSSPCLNDPSNNTLYGDKILNTHQIRHVLWKPAANGLTQSDVIFHLNQSPSQAVSMIEQNGITLYLSTPTGDFWLDNFR